MLVFWPSALEYERGRAEDKRNHTQGRRAALGQHLRRCAPRARVWHLSSLLAPDESGKVRNRAPTRRYPRDQRVRRIARGRVKTRKSWYSSRGFGGTGMKRFIEGQDRRQLILLPDCLDDYVGEDNPVRVVDAFIDELDLAALGFDGVVPELTGRPAYHPATLLKIYLYGYLNRVQSSRRLEREAQRNIELMWLTGRLAPDFKTSPTSAR